MAANVQAGKTNNQTLGNQTTNAPSVSLRPQSRVDKIDQSSKDSDVIADRVDKVVVQERDNFLVLVLLLCFIAWSYFLYLLPSPGQLWRKKK